MRKSQKRRSNAKSSSVSQCANDVSWREAVSDRLAVAVSYAQMAQLAAGVEDDLAFNHGLKNFFCAAREASSIYRDFRPRAPWETGANA